MIIALPYISTVAMLFCLYLYGNIKQINKKQSLYFSWFYLLIFFGFRGYIFTDVIYSYKPFFDFVPMFTAIDTNFVKWSWWEPGFVYYCSFFKLFTNNYFVFQFFDCLIDIILLYKALSWFDSNDPLSCMIFFAMAGLSIFVDTLRNVKAILIFFVSLRYIASHKLIKYICCCFIALSFHTSSIVFFPLYFFISKKYSKNIFVFFFFFGFIMLAFSSKIFSPLFLSLIKILPGRLPSMIESYVIDTNRVFKRVLSFGLLEKIVTFILVIIFFEKIYQDRMILIVNSFLFYYVFYFSFSDFYEVSERLSILFVFSYWILWPCFVKVLHTKYMKELFLICLLTYAVLKCSLYSQAQQRYENILFGAMSYAQRIKWNNR
jgi:hypothetical protein